MHIGLCKWVTATECKVCGIRNERGWLIYTYASSIHFISLHVHQQEQLPWPTCLVEEEEREPRWKLSSAAGWDFWYFCTNCAAIVLKVLSMLVSSLDDVSTTSTTRGSLDSNSFACDSSTCLRDIFWRTKSNFVPQITMRMSSPANLFTSSNHRFVLWKLSNLVMS